MSQRYRHTQYSALAAALIAIACGGKAVDTQDERGSTESNSTGSGAENTDNSVDASDNQVDASSGGANEADSDETDSEDVEPTTIHPPSQYLDSPASRCGTDANDEGTESEPVLLHFDDLWGEGWLTHVGTGASCYLIDGVTGGNQLFLEAAHPDGNSDDLQLDLALYEYSDAGFASEPICTHAADDPSQTQCPTGGTGGIVSVESDLRYIVVDGRATMDGGPFVLQAEP